MLLDLSFLKWISLYIFFLNVFLTSVLTLNLFCCFYFWAALCLHCCVWAFSSCDEQGLLFIVVHRLLIAVASLVEQTLEQGFEAGDSGSLGKTEPLFSPRYSKDKASGRSWVLLKQRDKVPTPEVKEDFPVSTCSGSLLENRKVRGPHSIISVDMQP